jgi:hypothetical protein
VVIGTAEGCADALEVKVVTRLLLVEAGVVDGPFFLGGWAHVVVDALVVLVEGDIALCCACGEIVGDMGAIFGLSCCWLLSCTIESGGNVQEGAFVAETTKALIVLACGCGGNYLGSCTFWKYLQCCCEDFCEVLALLPKAVPLLVSRPSVVDALSPSVIESLGLLDPLAHISCWRGLEGTVEEGFFCAAFGLWVVDPLVWAVFVVGRAAGRSDHRNTVGKVVMFKLNWWKSELKPAACTSVTFSRTPLKGTS